MTTCPTCGVDSPYGSRFCKGCGREFPPTPILASDHVTPGPARGELACKVCMRTPLPQEFTFCVSCGDPMCLQCAVGSKVAMTYSYSQNYVVVDREVSIQINFPRCGSCPRMEEALVASIRDRLRPRHPMRYRIANVRNGKYASEDAYIGFLQGQLAMCSQPENMLGCPRCSRASDANEYHKLLKRMEAGEFLTGSLIMGPFGEGGKPLPDLVVCPCGYAGVFVSGWGLRRFVERFGRDLLVGTVWQYFSASFAGPLPSASPLASPAMSAPTPYPTPYTTPYPTPYTTPYPTPYTTPAPYGTPPHTAYPGTPYPPPAASPVATPVVTGFPTTPPAAPVPSRIVYPIPSAPPPVTIPRACPRCGILNSSDLRFCTNCGMPLR